MSNVDTCNLLKNLILTEQGRHEKFIHIGTSKFAYDIVEDSFNLYFAGTMATFADWLENFHIKPKKVNGYWVHEGFYNGVYDVQKILINSGIDLAQFKYVRFVGYSQGAAQACIAPIVFDTPSSRCESIGFCGPKSIWKDSVDCYNIVYKFTNYVHPLDIVPDVPLIWSPFIGAKWNKQFDTKHLTGWQHVGKKVYVYPDYTSTQKNEILRRVQRTLAIIKDVFTPGLQLSLLQWHNLVNLQHRLCGY